MIDDSSSSHSQAEELLDYLDEKLPDGRQRAVEEHLAVCASCTQRARSLYLMNESWDWTAEQHGALHQREMVARALEAAEAMHPDVRERLRTWRERWSGLAEAGVRVVVEGSGAVARVVAEGLDALARPGAEWQFRAAQRPIGARGPAQDEPAPALLTTAVGADRPAARIAVRGGPSTEIELRIDGLPAGAAAPIVLLIEATQPGAPRVAAIEIRAGAAYRLARFTGVPPGEYVVVFEPLARRRP